jgi:hypothetical protein
MRAERFSFALALLALTSAVAHAQATWDEAAARLRAASLTQEQVLVIVERARARGLAPQNIAPWADRAAGLAQNGIPAAIAGERLAQGLAKGVALDRLDSALAQLDDNLRWLNGFFDRITARAERRNNPGQSELALRAAEAALRGGLERAELERAFGPGPVTLEQAIAFSQAAGSLLAANVDRVQVVRALAGAAKAGVAPDELRRLEQRFVAALAGGRPAAAAFDEFKSGLERLVREAGTSAVQHEQLRQEMRETMRQTLRAPGGPDMRPSGGPSSGASHSKAGKR